MVLTNDKKLAERIKSLRVHGADPKYYHKEVGYNSRLDAIQAAILRVKLKYLNEWNEGRQKVAAIYERLFKKYGLEDTIIIPHKKIENSTHVYHQYVVRVSNRDELQRKLKEKGISTAVYYPVPLHLQECYKEFGYKEGDLVISEQACKEVLALPIDPEISAEQVEYVIGIIKKYMKKYDK
ncbi:MAG: DegT/DnrJ/EryC1/StrS family aminotransferase, partial [bacterium]